MTSPEEYECLWPADDDSHFGYPADEKHLEEENLTNSSSNKQNYSIPLPPSLPNYTSYLTKRHHKKQSNYSGIICTKTRNTWDQVFKQEFGADVYVITDSNTTIPAHSIILRVASPVLASLLLQSKPKNGKFHLKLPDAPYGAVYAFIRFLYSSCYEEDDMKKYVLHLLVLSHAFCVSQLKRVCVEFMEQQWLTTENVIDVLQLARNCDAPRLSLICVHMIIKNFKSVSSSDGWRAMRRSNPSLEQELLESAVDSDSRKQERLVREEKMVYVQLHEAMEALLHFCKDGCRSNKINQIKCKRSACKSIEMLVGHFSGCKRRVRGGCVHCKRLWQLFELHSRMCDRPEICEVPLCWQFKEKVRHPSKKDEAKWRLLVKKVIEAKSVENPLFKSKFKFISS